MAFLYYHFRQIGCNGSKGAVLISRLFFSLLPLPAGNCWDFFAWKMKKYQMAQRLCLQRIWLVFF